jgi:hypothetical protein
MRLDLRLELQQQRRPTREQRLEALAVAIRDAGQIKAKFGRERAVAASKERAADRAWRLGMTEARKLAGPDFDTWARVNRMQEARSGNTET